MRSTATIRRWTVLTLVIAFLMGCLERAPNPSERLVTEYGLGPDKWATAWLLSRFVVPGADLEVLPAGAALPEGLHFDVEGSQLRRTGGRSAFEVTREQHGIDGTAIAFLGKIVQEIEVEFWQPPRLVASRGVERGFRGLQQAYGRDSVSPDCYLAFFDRVYERLEASGLEEDLSLDGDLLIDCGAVDLEAAGRNRLVPEVPIEHLLREMARGKTVAFVDVREPDEFAEGHIPDALNLAIRDLDDAIVGLLGSADYVVSYCVKDFRGFEMAKALRLAGVENSVILRPFGVQGWIQAGLPVVGSRGTSEGEARAQLLECVADPGICLPERRGNR